MSRCLWKETAAEISAGRHDPALRVPPPALCSEALKRVIYTGVHLHIPWVFLPTSLSSRKIPFHPSLRKGLPPRGGIVYQVSPGPGLPTGPPALRLFLPTSLPVMVAENESPSLHWVSLLPQVIPQSSVSQSKCLQSAAVLRETL